MNTRFPLDMLLVATAAIAFGCGGSGSTNENETPPDAATADGGSDARGDTITDDAHDSAPIVDAKEDVGTWKETVSVLGIGTAVGTGVLGPVYPMSVSASTDQVVVVGLARADFSWGGTTYPRGGFVLAIDAKTGAVRWHRQVGDSVGAITTVGDDLAIVGSFSKSISLPTAAAPIALTSAGRTDGVVAVLTRAGDFRWARRYGSPSFDQGFAIASDGDAVVVAGAITGVADLGEGCGTLQAQTGGDDGDGHPAGIYDAVVLRYPAGGACPWGAALGAPLADDMAFGVTVIDGALFVTGSSSRPMSLRTTLSSSDVDLGGPPTKRPSPFLLRLHPKSTRAPSTWFVTEAGGGRGRALAHRGTDLSWAFTSGAGSKLVHDALPPIEISDGAHIVVLRDETLVRKIDFGPKTLDIGPLALGDALTIVAASEFDPGGVLFAKIDATSTSIARHAAAGATGLPFATAISGTTIWIAGYTGAPISLGDPPVKIEPGPEGGFFLARLGL